MVAVKDTIQQRLDKIRYNYLLLLHPEKIEIPKDLSETEKDKYIKKIYQEKAKLHEKLGAKKFQKFVKKFDKAKFKFIKRFIKEDRMIKWSDKITDYNTRKLLKIAKTDEEKKAIIENMKRGKVLVRKQLKEERSVNYYQGVDNRVENFHKYIIRNKEIHKNSLKINGLLLGASIGLGVVGVPILPLVLGGYQILAGFKNFQCVNAQNYYLSMMRMREKSIVKKNLTGIKRIYDENPDLMEEIKKGIKAGKDLYCEKGILDSVNSLEGLRQLKKRLMDTMENQYTTTGKSKEEITVAIDAVLEKMIIPPENSSESQTAKGAVRK